MISTIHIQYSQNRCVQVKILSFNSKFVSFVIIISLASSVSEMSVVSTTVIQGNEYIFMMEQRILSEVIYCKCLEYNA